MKKIAIPTNGGQVAAHFGRCPQFTIVEVDKGEIVNKNVIDNPGHTPGFLPRFLNEKGVDCVLAAGMGRRAVDLFAENNIEIVTGVSGKVENGLNKYINDNLDPDRNFCNHGHDDHSCDH